jgi:sn-glycerol 3-phosphate transport system permease protein
MGMKADGRLLGLIAAGAAALLWAVPFAWMAVASLRPGVPADIASLTPAGPFNLSNFAEAWRSGDFLVWYLNTLAVCGGILAVQLVTISAAGYAFARLSFPGRDLVFALFLLQLLLIPTLLIVPNLATLVSLHLYDTLPGIMAP